MPSWNITVTSLTSSSLTVKWSDFPSSLPVQRFLVKYKEQNSNVSLVFQASSSYNTHHSGRVLKAYQFYEVKVIAVAASVGNGTYSSEAVITRTKEGGRYNYCKCIYLFFFLLLVCYPFYHLSCLQKVPALSWNVNKCF